MSAEVMDRPGAGTPVYDDAPAPPLTRMAIAVLSMVGIFIAGYLSLYKLGYIGEITCAVGGCDIVQNSPWAYFLGIPVAVWGVGAYVSMFLVALLGLQPRFVDAPWVRWGLFGMSLVGVVFSGYLTWLEAFRIHAWCQWCVISAILVTVIFLLSLPGLKRAR